MTSGIKLNNKSNLEKKGICFGSKGKNRSSKGKKMQKN
jgi:hypothetical protein